MYSVLKNSSIYNFLSETGVTSQFSKPAIRHIESFMNAAIQKGFSGKIVDVERFSHKHRTTLGHFVSKGKWDESFLSHTIKENISAKLSEKSNTVFVSIDDTVSCKKKPSLQAITPMQGTGYHHSSLEKRRVWGHKVQAVMMSCGDLSFNYDIHLCEKDLDKITYAQKVASFLPILEQKSCQAPKNDTKTRVRIYA